MSGTILLRLPYAFVAWTGKLYIGLKYIARVFKITHFTSCYSLPPNFFACLDGNFCLNFDVILP
jgi:hypothetical protein